MEITNGEIINSIGLLSVLAEAELPAVSCIRISRTLNELEEQREIIQDARQEIVSQYQATNAEGEPLFKVSEASARREKIQEKAAESDADAEDIDFQDVELEKDLPEKATSDHPHATQQEFIPESKQEEMNDELNALFEDTVDLNTQPIPADQLKAFEDAFYDVLEDHDQFDVERSPDASGLRPGDIAPIEFIFPQDL